MSLESHTSGPFARLLDAQRQMPRLQKNATNPHFGSKYVSLDSLHADVLPVLHERDLVWVTRPATDDQGRPALGYSLIDALTGEPVVEGMMLLGADKVGPQAQGSAITYARRYSLMAVLGLVGEDDDGNAAQRGKAKAKTDDERPAATRIPRDRAKAILDRAMSLDYAHKSGSATMFEPVFAAVLAKHGIDKITQLNVDQAEAVEQWLRAEAAETGAN